jgi:hypothetical protein
MVMAPPRAASAMQFFKKWPPKILNPILSELLGPYKNDAPKIKKLILMRSTYADR